MTIKLIPYSNKKERKLLFGYTSSFIGRFPMQSEINLSTYFDRILSIIRRKNFETSGHYNRKGDPGSTVEIRKMVTFWMYHALVCQPIKTCCGHLICMFHFRNIRLYLNVTKYLQSSELHNIPLLFFQITLS